MGNTMRARVIRCIARGGLQHPGHAAFYEDGSIDNVWERIRHEGPGFGFKAHHFRNTKVIAPRFQGSSAAIYAQAGSGMEVSDGNYACPPDGGIAIQIEGIGGAGPCENVNVENFSARRATPGTSVYHVGLRLLSKDGQAVKNISVANSTFDGFYSGHSCDNLLNSSYSDISLRGNKFLNCSGQGGVALFSSGAIESNTYTTLGGNSPALLASMCANGDPAQNPGGTVRIRNNVSSGPKLVGHFLIGSGHVVHSSVRWDLLEIEGNLAEGGAMFASVSWDKSPTDYIKLLRIDSNIHKDAIPGGVSVNIFLNRNNKTRVFAQANSFRASDGTYNSVRYINSEQALDGSIHDGNEEGPVYDRPPNAL